MVIGVLSKSDFGVLELAPAFGHPVWYRACTVVALMLIFPVIGLCSETEVDKSPVSQQEFRVLISNSIRSIAADAGNVWIATDSGVSRFSLTSIHNFSM